MKTNDSMNFSPGPNASYSISSFTEESATTDMIDITALYFVDINTLSIADLIKSGVNCVNFLAGCTFNLLALLASLRIMRRLGTQGLLMVDFFLSNLLFCVMIADRVFRTLYRRYYNPGLCKARAFTLYVAGGSTILSLLLMAFYRYFRIVRPNNPAWGFSNRKRTLVSIGIKWFFPILNMSLPLTEAWGKYGFEPANKQCRMLIAYNYGFEKSLIITYFALPVIVQAFIYSRIFYKVRQQHRRVMALTENSSTRGQSMQVTTTRPNQNASGSSSSSKLTSGNVSTVITTISGNVPLQPRRDQGPRDQGPSHTILKSAGLLVPGPSTLTPCEQRQRPRSVETINEAEPRSLQVKNTGVSTRTVSKSSQKKELRLTLIVFSLMVTYVVCLLPYTVSTAAGLHQYAVHTLFTCLAWLHVTINPVIYTLSNSELRKALRGLIQCP